jgi:hypothetical protein
MAEEGPVILIAMSEGVPDEDHATEIIQKIAQLVYKEVGDRSPFG